MLSPGSSDSCSSREAALLILGGPPGGLTGKSPPAKEETRVWSLGQEDPLEQKMAPTPVFLPGESHGQRKEPGGLQSMGLQKVSHNWGTKQ